MRRSGTPKMALVIHGDWYSVIGCREYRDVLLDQKPMDDEDAEYYCYRIPCETVEDLCKAYLDFRKIGIRGEMQFDWQTEDRGVNVHMRTGYAGDRKPVVDVTVNESQSPIEEAAKQAIEILREALK